MMSSTTGSNSPSSASADEDSISLPPRTKSDHEQSRSNTHTNIVRNSLIAGSVSGMASTVALYPLDVVRTKMQSAAMHGSALHGPMQTFRHTLQHGGIQALYTGLALPLAAQAVYKGCVFTINNTMQKVILDFKRLDYETRGIHREPTLNMADLFLCGFVGGGVNALLFVTPVEFVRNQLIAQHSKVSMGRKVARIASGSLDVITHSVRKHGFFSMWRGANMSVWRDSIGCGCFFYTMAWTQRLLTPPNENPSFPVTVLSGALSGLAFWVSSLPLDTVKTWIQSADLTESYSVRDTLYRIYQRNGSVGVMKELFRGWQVAYSRGIPSAAVTISVYSYVYRLLQPE